MGYMHSMFVETHGIRSIAPVQWRSYDTMCGVFWEAEGCGNATGYYLSPDPRIMLFFQDVSQHIGMSKTGPVDDPQKSPLARAIYVPAGMPLWTKFGAGLTFSHLDIHLKEAWLIDRFSRETRDGLYAEQLLHANYMHDDKEVQSIGQALKQAVCSGRQHPLVSESLAIALVAALVANRDVGSEVALQSGGLTPIQMRRLLALLTNHPARRFLTAELAEEVRLSPSWFTHAFKRTTGKSPLQWQHERRIDLAKQRLAQNAGGIAEVATEFGFADQAHFTRVFRKVTGATPAAWMREACGVVYKKSRLISYKTDQA